MLSPISRRSLLDICKTNKKAFRECQKSILRSSSMKMGGAFSNESISERCVYGALIERDRAGNTALCYCTINDDVECFRYLFETVGARCIDSLITIQNEDLNTLFHLAAIHSSVEVARYLADLLNSEMDFTNSRITPCNIIHLLYKVTNIRGDTALHCIAENDENVEILRCFEKVVEDFQSYLFGLSNGDTVLFRAVRNEQFLMADEILGILDMNEAAFDYDELAMCESNPPTPISHTFVGVRRVGGVARGSTLYTSSFVGLAASNCSLEIIRYLYARGYDFSSDACEGGKLGQIVGYVMAMTRTTLIRTMFNQAFIDTIDIFTDIAHKYANNYCSTDSEDEPMERLIPSLHTLCMRSIVYKRIDRCGLHPTIFDVRNDLEPNYIYDIRYEKSISPDAKVDRAKRKLIDATLANMRTTMHEFDHNARFVKIDR